MVKSCCVIDCKNRFNKNSELSFYRLPKEKEKRSRWIAAIRRFNWNPGNETWICGCHFVSGKKSDDPLHPDYVPSLFSFTSAADRARAFNSLERYLRAHEISEEKFVNTATELAATAVLNMHQSPASDADVLTVQVQGAEVKKEETHDDVASLYDQINSLHAECQSLRDKVHKLENTPKIAFSVGSGILGTYGPFNTEVTLRFSNVLTNVGNAYSPHTGIFKAPVKGVYHLSASVFGSTDIWVEVYLMKSGQRIFGMSESPKGSNMSISRAVNLLLEQDDEVYLNLRDHCQIYDDGQTYNTFSGSLLFPM